MIRIPHLFYPLVRYRHTSFIQSSLLIGCLLQASMSSQYYSEVSLFSMCSQYYSLVSLFSTWSQYYSFVSLLHVVSILFFSLPFHVPSILFCTVSCSSLHVPSILFFIVSSPCVVKPPLFLLPCGLQWTYLSYSVKINMFSLCIQSSTSVFPA